MTMNHTGVPMWSILILKKQALPLCIPSMHACNVSELFWAIDAHKQSLKLILEAKARQEQFLYRHKLSVPFASFVARALLGSLPSMQQNTWSLCLLLRKSLREPGPTSLPQSSWYLCILYRHRLPFLPPAPLFNPDANLRLSLKDKEMDGTNHLVVIFSFSWISCMWRMRIGSLTRRKSQPARFSWSKAKHQTQFLRPYPTLTDRFSVYFHPRPLAKPSCYPSGSSPHQTRAGVPDFFSA